MTRIKEYKIPVDALPKKGYVMAYFQDALVFEPYEVKGGRIVCGCSERLEKELPRECHFFDADREYRMLLREARGDIIETVLTKEEEEEMDPDLLFRDEGLVREEFSSKPGMPEKLCVINRYVFSENDTLILKSYRISV